MRLSADAVRWHRMRHQGLVPGHALDSVKAVAERVGGIQAQTLTNMGTAIAARMRPADAPTASQTRQMVADGTLVRSWAMRSTLHAFAPEQWGRVCAVVCDRETERQRGRAALDDRKQEPLRGR